MKQDETKTKAELIEELRQLRFQLDDLKNRFDGPSRLPDCSADDGVDGLAAYHPACSEG